MWHQSWSGVIKFSLICSRWSTWAVCCVTHPHAANMGNRKGARVAKLPQWAQERLKNRELKYKQRRPIFFIWSFHFPFPMDLSSCSQDAGNAIVCCLKTQTRSLILHGPVWGPSAHKSSMCRMTSRYLFVSNYQVSLNDSWFLMSYFRLASKETRI